MVEKYLKSNLCHLPWTGIETRPNGFYKPCCLYKEILKTPENENYNVKDHGIEEVMNSTDMKQLRQQFKNGEKPEGCSACWKEESAGKMSKRQHMWTKAFEIGQAYVKKDKVGPIMVDLKLGNICNLKCRICSAQSSSQWVNDMIKLDPRTKDKWKNVNKQGSWPREQNKFFEDLPKFLKDVRYFEITGGEPLMIEQQFDILRKCIDLGSAKYIDVHYNTNGTHFPEKAITEIWPHFKRIELAFSIDDVEKRFEYQRHPATWDNVSKNIHKFFKCGLNNLSTQICTTINFFNIHYLDELAEQVYEWNPDFWHINILHWPVEFDVQMLPIDVKLKIKDKLQRCKIYQKELQSAVNYMLHPPQRELDNYKKILYHKIKEIDAIRDENFAEVFPTLNNLLGIYE